MKKLLLVLLLLVATASSSYAQGIHGGFSTGSQIFKIEAGYSLDENIHLGAYYSLGLDLSVYPLPSSYGVYGRYTFEKREIFNSFSFDVNMRPYLSASLGQIKTNEIPSLSGSFDTDGSMDTTPSKTEFGYLASCGIELLYGRNSSWGSFFEFGFGKSPSYFKAISSTLNGITTMEEPEGTGLFSFSVGFRFYFN